MQRQKAKRGPSNLRVEPTTARQCYRDCLEHESSQCSAKRISGFKQTHRKTENNKQ